jgi:putative FmdB family regulatory protein
MPTYEYRCSDCTNSFEIVQKFSDPSLTTCPDCDGNLRKVFSAVGVVFKGSGFYATDNRTKGKSNAATSSSSSAESTGSSSGGSSSSDAAGASSSGAGAPSATASSTAPAAAGSAA